MGDDVDDHPWIPWDDSLLIIMNLHVLALGPQGIFILPSWEPAALTLAMWMERKWLVFILGPISDFWEGGLLLEVGIVVISFYDNFFISLAICSKVAHDVFIGKWCVLTTTVFGV